MLKLRKISATALFDSGEEGLSKNLRRMRFAKSSSSTAWAPLTYSISAVAWDSTWQSDQLRVIREEIRTSRKFFLVNFQSAESGESLVSNFHQSPVGLPCSNTAACKFWTTMVSEQSPEQIIEL